MLWPAMHYELSGGPMAARIIFWPGLVSDDIVDFLRDVHKLPWAEVVSYDQLNIGDHDEEGIRAFLNKHKDPEQFVYVTSKTHVAVVIDGKEEAGWVELNEDGFIVAVFHSLPEMPARGYSPSKKSGENSMNFPFTLSYEVNQPPIGICKSFER